MMHTALQSSKKKIDARELFLASDKVRVRIENSGTCSNIFSTDEKRIIFGQSSLLLFKVKAGITIQLRPIFSFIDTEPSNATMESLIDESILIRQKVRITKSGAFLRSVSLRNSSANLLSVKLIFFLDPCAVHFSGYSAQGALGVNVFNRGNHVVMDEVGLGSVRIAGVSRIPSKIYMTKEKSMFERIVSTGTVPDSTFGTSSQPIVFFENNIDLRPMSSEEISYSLVYSRFGIEDAFRKYNSSFAEPPYEARARIFCSDPDVEFAFKYSVACLESCPEITDTLEFSECISSFLLIAPENFEKVAETIRKIAGKEGYIPHSLDWRYPGLLETSLTLCSISNFLSCKERKLIKKNIGWLKKLATFLSKYNEVLKEQARLPQGWRRAIRYGLPSQIVPEVLFAISSALNSFSEICLKAGKPEDSARFSNLAKTIDEDALEMIDKDGKIALFSDLNGNKQWDETIDQTVACYRKMPNIKAASYAYQRANSEDFETGFGPRTVPASNKTYFNPYAAYGQVGGYWTRAAIAHCILGYKLGLTKAASLELCNISSFVSKEAINMGSALGEIPYSVDVESRKITYQGNDPVAASRLVEAILLHELGIAPNQPPKPTQDSRIDWTLAYQLCVDGYKALFVSRYGSHSFFLVAGKVPSFDGQVYSSFKLDRAEDSIITGSFYGPGQVLFAASRHRPLKLQCEIGILDSSIFNSGKAVLELFEPEKLTWIEEQRLGCNSKVKLNLESERCNWIIARIRKV